MYRIPENSKEKLLKIVEYKHFFYHQNSYRKKLNHTLKYNECIENIRRLIIFQKTSSLKSINTSIDSQENKLEISDINTNEVQELLDWIRYIKEKNIVPYEIIWTISKLVFESVSKFKKYKKLNEFC
jgi:hypothetical protein